MEGIFFVPIGEGKEEQFASYYDYLNQYQFPIGKGKNNILSSLDVLYTIYIDLSMEKSGIFDKNVQRIDVFLLTIFDYRDRILLKSKL